MPDTYTPHGYLHVHGHARNLNPKGVLRSSALGFAWHYPNHASGYGHRREHYRASLEFDVGTPPTHCDEHTSNVKRFVTPGGLHATFCPAGDDALLALVEVNTETTFTARVTLRRVLSPLGEWGESGLIVRPDQDGLVVQTFEDGPAFHLRTSSPPQSISAADAQGHTELQPGDFMTVTGRAGDEVEVQAHLRFTLQPGVVLRCTLARGVTADAARTEGARAHAAHQATLAAHRAHDAAFATRAPALTDGWPDHWRRGLHYDLHTLRMMPKDPVGRYLHPWDAMQVQAPRVVLAEAAMDALALAHADPANAQAMLLGVFRNAERPNVPCGREDGSLNMLAADGTPCGTGPQWGYPYLAAQRLFELHPDEAWLRDLYPHLAAFHRFWQDERAARDGTLGFVCSWESGQDDSPRFGAQPLGGGHPVRHVMPVDLYAAMAHAAHVLARFADHLGYRADARTWRADAERYARDCAALFTGARYADRDTHSGAFTDVNDVMLTAPFALQVAPEAHHPAGRAEIGALDARGGVWPMFVWTEVLAAETLGLHERAARTLGHVIERVYRRWDAREEGPDRTLPGVACEYWPHHDRCGGEGYGWGAFLTHLLLRHLVGHRPAQHAFLLQPNLPPELRDGRTLGVQLTHHGHRVHLTLRGDPHHCHVTVNGRPSTLTWGETLTLPDDALTGAAHDEPR